MPNTKGGLKPPEPGQSLADLYPLIASEAVGWDPFSVRWGSDVKLPWKCSEGHSWIAAVVKRSRMGRGCPYCTNHKVLPGYNDLRTHYPDVASQAYGWDPSQVSSKSSRKFEWKCATGHNWVATVGSRTGLGNGCPICGNKLTVTGINDLQTLCPELALEAFGWDPSIVNPGSNVKQMWKCPLDHQWKASVDTRAHRGYGCPICSHKQLLAGFNDLATTHPDVAAQAYGWDPTTVIGGTHKKKMWKCELGHTWETSPKKRAFGVMNNCPICGNKQVLVGFNDLATTNPALASEADGWDPTSLTCSSGKMRRWVCSVGHGWDSTIANRANGNGCPSCAKGGFDPNEDGYLYLLEHEDLDMSQIGITNYPQDRLDTHRRAGWKPVDIRGPMQGDLARNLERDGLLALSRRGAQLGRRRAKLNFSGHTEAWPTQTLRLVNLAQLISWVYEDEAQ